MNEKSLIKELWKKGKSMNRSICVYSVQPESAFVRNSTRYFKSCIHIKFNAISCQRCLDIAHMKNVKNMAEKSNQQKLNTKSNRPYLHEGVTKYEVSWNPTQ